MYKIGKFLQFILLGDIWMCPQCKKIFKKFNYLKKHMRYICGMAAMFKCPHADCTYSGKKKANLHLHIMNKHTNIRSKLPKILKNLE